MSTIEAPIRSDLSTVLRLPKLGILAAYGLILIGVLRLLPALSFTSFHNDFSHYYLGGSIFRQGLNPYTEPLQPHCEAMGVAYDPLIPYAAHPPLLLTLFSWISVLPPAGAYALWLVVQALAILVSIELTRRIVRAEWSSAIWLALVAVLVNATSLRALVYFSQVQLFIGGILYGALLAHLKGRNALACGMVTFAAAFKIYPIVLLPWFFLRGLRSRADFGLRVGTAAVVGVVCLFVPGTTTWIDFFTLGVPTLAENAVQWNNYSVQSLVFHLSRTPISNLLVGEHTDTVKLLASLASVAMIATSYFLATFVTRDDRSSFSILLIACVLSGFIAWSHYLVLLFLPIAWLVMSGLPSSRPWTLASGWIVGIPVSVPLFDFLFLPEGHDLLRTLAHFYPLLGALLTLPLLARVGTNAGSMQEVEMSQANMA